MNEGALDALVPELARLELLIHREILRLRARYELSLDEFRGLYVSDQQVDELLRAAGNDEQPIDLSALTSKADNLVQELAACERSDTNGAPWSQLGQKLDLSRAQRDLLLLALAPELDAKYEILYAYLNNDVSRKFPTLELAGRLFGNTPHERIAMRGLLTPDALLASLGAIEFASTTLELSRAQRGLRLPQPLIDWLLGFSYNDERLSTLCRNAPHTVDSPYSAESEAGRMLQAMAEHLARNGSLPLLMCFAPTASEAATAGATLFARTGRKCLMLDLHALAQTTTPARIISAIELTSRVLDLGIVASPAEALFKPEGSVLEAPTAALQHLCTSGCNLVLAAKTGTAVNAVLSADARTVEIHLPELDVAARASLWQEALGDETDRLDIEALADRFPLDADRIARAARIARDRAAFDNRALANADLFSAARTVSGQGEQTVTRNVTTKLDWDDLVLPPLARRRLQDMLHTVRQRHRVLDQWGFGRRMNGARGMKALFAGVSGTGKTMAAALVARRLGFDMHRIEIAGVVSKYIGETEKNLDRAFDVARRGNAILFIDEADALFGKRSEVKDAHDRYANVEIAYLLQKMEDHDGVVILATNLAKNIDESFSRRMHFVIEFPVPDIASRERLWRGMFPASAPVADDVDFGFLARQFEFTGGAIRNVALEAAYAAAAQDSAIEMHHLLQAVAQEYMKRGKVPPATKFREFLPLLAQSNDAVGTA